MTDDVRPYWGEKPEVVGEWSLHWTHVSEPPRRTFQERHDAYVREGLCPADKSELDDDGFCSICGFDAAKDRPPETPEMRDDYLPTLPAQLLIDEWAPAQVDEEAAA